MSAAERLEELQEVFKDAGDGQKKVIWPLLKDVAFLEERLRELRKLPMIRIHPRNPARQEVTAAGKQYKEFMQSYLNAVKVLEKALAKEAEGGDSPLKKMLEEFADDGEDLS